MRYVAYYRVSTAKQGASGLGLEAQQAAVLAHCKEPPIQSFTEVESGKRNNRPELAAALALAKRERATLVIAKLDRLARNMALIANLMESGVDIVAVDMPTANRFTLHIMAAVAEQEAKAIGERTRAALAAARARGVRLGTPDPSRIGTQARTGADAFARSLAPTIEELRCAGIYSVRDICSALNARGILTNRGAQWHPTSVQRLMDRLADQEMASLSHQLKEYHPSSLSG
ncbi:recombinase family protein [Methylorubrum extorquens]|uniref:recombinase family protein n=1 Tax=Methylorubrum extorquens TaxID=408 RepID=UPI001EE627D4|nr:recombinase family protein [Methylorubrum extorquens]MCG5249611.1 recombinase family protein [Methylorubrum extorquens]